MLRRVFLITSFSTALVICSFGIVSIWRDVGWRGLIGESDHFGVIEIVEGNLRILHARQHGRPYQNYRFLRRMPSVGTIHIRIGNNRAGWHYAGVTLPIWLIVVALFAHPTLAFFYGPVRRRNRRKRYECVRCGYSRVGDTTGRCPECRLQWVCAECGKDMLNRNATALLLCDCLTVSSP